MCHCRPRARPHGRHGACPRRPDPAAARRHVAGQPPEELSPLRARLDRLARAGRSILQIVLAATAAWLIATELLDHDRPFFAPVAAIVTLGLTTGQRPRRAVEIGIGVTLGILVGDLLVLGLGTGAAQLALVLAVVMVLAVLLGSAPLFVQQSAVSAALVVTIQPPTEGFDFARSIDALVGSGCALAVHLVLLPVNPLVDVRRAAEPLVTELAATLRDIAAALRAGDAAAAEGALLRARAIQPHEAAFAEAVAAGRETARLAPPRRRAREPLLAYAEAVAQIDLAQRNTRVLARAALRALQIGEHIPPRVPEAVEALAAAAGGVTAALAEHDRVDVVREQATQAAAIATVALEQTGNLSVATMVSQVRSTAVDLLRSTGLTREEAVDAVRRAADEALQATHEDP